jgi:hypothetical protein
MERTYLNDVRTARALAALSELRSALQQAHFAARLLEELLPPAPADRPSDRIHALRTATGRLAADIQAMLGGQRAVDLRTKAA